MWSSRSNATCHCRGPTNTNTNNCMAIFWVYLSLISRSLCKQRKNIVLEFKQWHHKFSLSHANPTSPLILYIIKTRSKIPSKAKRRESTQSQLNECRNCMTNNKTDKAVVSINQATTRCIRPCQEIRGCDGGWGGGYHPPLSA